jgi:hypothetical protein
VKRYIAAIIVAIVIGICVYVSIVVWGGNVINTHKGDSTDRNDVEVRFYILSGSSEWFAPPAYPEVKTESEYVIIIRNRGITEEIERLIERIAEDKKGKTIKNDYLFAKYTGEIYINGVLQDWFSIGGHHGMLINGRVVALDVEVMNIVQRYAGDL